MLSTQWCLTVGLLVGCWCTSINAADTQTLYNAHTHHNDASYELTRHRHQHTNDHSSTSKHELMQPDWSIYHTADQLYDSINTIASRNTEYIHVSTPFSHNTDFIDHPYKHQIQLVEISNFHSPVDDSDKLHIQLTFGEHGREIISSEIALKLIQLFDIDASTYLHSYALLSPEFKQYILDNVHIYLVPVLNVWSHKQVEQGKVCERKNINGVDPNRNYAYDFKTTNNKGKLIPVTDEQYPGTQAFSELESHFVRYIGEIIVDRHSVHDLYINVHSGVREMYRGWDSSPDPIPNYKQVDQLLEFINVHHCSCKTGGAGLIGGYVVNGGSMDYMYTQYNISHSLTYEVYGDATRSQSGFFDCYPFFNPITAHEVDNQTIVWSYSFLSASLYLLTQKHQRIYPYTLPSYLSDSANILQPKHIFEWTHEISYTEQIGLGLIIVVSIVAIIVLVKAYQKYSQSLEYQQIPQHKHRGQHSSRATAHPADHTV